MHELDAEIVVRGGRDAFTDARQDVGRVTYRLGARRYVLLACREGGDWFPTWLGEEKRGDAVRIPPGFSLSPEIIAALAAASSGATQGTGTHE